MKHINVTKLKECSLETNPFEYVVIPNFLNTESLLQVISSYPNITKGGSYPLDTVEISSALNGVIEEMNSREFEEAIEEKFSVDLKGKPKMYSLRGYCRKTDGKIHTDSKDKIITVLLYLNDNWQYENGKLRLLRSGKDIEDFATEVPPDNGTLLVFKRSDNSFHGHGPFEGVRRSIQMNWMVSEGRKGFHKLRHQLSASFKKLTAVN